MVAACLMLSGMASMASIFLSRSASCSGFCLGSADASSVQPSSAFQPFSSATFFVASLTVSAILLLISRNIVPNAPMQMPLSIRGIIASAHLFIVITSERVLGIAHLVMQSASEYHQFLSTDMPCMTEDASTSVFASSAVDWLVFQSRTFQLVFDKPFRLSHHSSPVLPNPAVPRSV